MLKIKFLLVAVLILSGLMFAQNLWTNEVPINFTIQANTKAASFVDASGIHIVYYKNGGIKYALVNSQGAVIKYDKAIEAEGQGTDFANVAVAGGNVYAIYYKNNDIKVARSTNLGDSWNNTYSYFDCINTACNKIVAYSDGTALHIAWSELRVGDYNYKDVHYIKFDPSLPNPWTEYKRVSDIDPPYLFGADNPDLVFSSGKVYVNYAASFWQPVNRDRNSNNTWNTPEVIPFNQLPMGNQAKDSKPFVIGNELNTVYKNAWDLGVLIGHSYKNLNGTTWTQDPNYLETDYLGSTGLYPHAALSTTDGKIHLIYYDKNQSLYSYRTLINHSFSSHIATIQLSSYISNCLLQNSNDLYLVRTSNLSTPGNILFRHYDAAPLAPQNPQLSANPGSGMVRFSWTKNNEADISAYEVWRKINTGNWQLISTTSNNYFVDPTYYYAPGAGDFMVTYKVRAKDVGNHLSTYSSEVSTRAEELGKQNVVNNSELDFRLLQNYPNPFNPSTKISYSIKEEGLVILKVYDVLGKEIVTLVNENKPAGYYEAEFNASQLPSGMYIYKIQVGSFSDVKKMSLTK